MTQFHTTERLGAVQSTTREGFLVCEGVPISRTGVLFYAPGELPIPPGPDGIIRVHRADDAVFDETSMRSFEGKSVVDLHPGVDVTPKNWKQFAVGHVQNVRRGEGEHTNKVVADLVIKDAAAITAVRAGKRHVSCGYDATYRVFAPGNAQQTNITGNHVALVPQGRCGPTCSIGDADMSTTWMDRVRSAFTTQDEGALAAALAEAPKPGSTAAGQPVIHIHTADKTASAPAAPAAAAPAAVDPQRATLDALAAITQAVEGLGAKFATLDAKVQTITDRAAADEAAAEAARVAAAAQATADAATEQARVAGEAAVAAEAARVPTGDSAGLQSVFQDCLARAEMLIPGVALPTFDAAAAPAVTEETLCGFRRRVLDAARTTGAGRDHVNALLPAGTEIAGMTCDAVGMVFQGATELAKVANNRGAPPAAGKPGTRVGPLTPAEINERNRIYYKV